MAYRTGLTPPAIRFYEQEGLLDKRHVRRGANNYRDYPEETVEHLQMIKRLQSAGFTLSELRNVLHNEEAEGIPVSRKIDLLRSKIEEISRRQAELEQVQRLLGKMLANKTALLEQEEAETANHKLT